VHSSGSLYVDYDVEYEDTPAVASGVTAAMLALVSPQTKLTFLNETVSAEEVTIGDNNATCKYKHAYRRTSISRTRINRIHAKIA